MKRTLISLVPWIPLRPRDVSAPVEYTIISLDNGLSPVRRQAMIWTNVGLMSIKICLNITSAKLQPSCLGLNTVNSSLPSAAYIIVNICYIYGLLSIGPWWTNSIETLNKIQTFLLKKMHMKKSSAKWRPSCPGWDELTSVWGMASHVLSINTAKPLASLLAASVHLWWNSGK